MDIISQAVENKAALKQLQKPPSTVLKQFFNNANGETIESISKMVLLPVEESKMWLEHLKSVVENQKRGAKKAAATRKSKNVLQPQMTTTCIWTIQIA